MDEKDASAAAQKLRDAIAQTDDGFRVLPLVRALGAVDPCHFLMGKKAAEATAAKLIDAMAQTDDVFWLGAFNRALGVVAPRLDETAADAAAEKALRAINESNLSTFAHCLGVLGPWMHEEEAHKIAQLFIHHTKVGDSNTAVNKQLAETLSEVAPCMDEKEAEEAAQRLLGAMDQTDDANTLQALAEALSAIALRMSPHAAHRHADAAAQKLVDAIVRAAQPRRLPADVVLRRDGQDQQRHEHGVSRCRVRRATLRISMRMRPTRQPRNSAKRWPRRTTPTCWWVWPRRWAQSVYTGLTMRTTMPRTLPPRSSSMRWP